LARTCHSKEGIFVDRVRWLIYDLLGIFLAWITGPINQTELFEPDAAGEKRGSKLSLFTRQYGDSEPSKGWGGLTGREYCVIVPILTPNMAEGLVHLAVALAGIHTASGQEEKRRVRVVVLGVVTVPEETPLSQGASLVKAYRTLLRYIPPESARMSDRVEVRTEVRVAREVWQGIADQVREEEADLLLLHWKGATQTPGKVYGTTIDALMEDPPCDIVLGCFNVLPEIKSILLPVRGGSYSSLSMRLVSNMAEQWGTTVTVMHNLTPAPAAIPAAMEEAYPYYPPPSQPGALNSEDLNALQSILTELPAGARLLTTQGNLGQTLAQEARSHDLLVLGASGGSPDSEAPKVALRIIQETKRPLLVVKTRKPLRLAPARSLATGESELRETVDRWFAQNTFHYREFRSLSSLTLLKERNDLSISLIIPVYGPTQPFALAEAVRRVRFALMRDCALIDELIISAPGVKLDAKEIALFKAKVELDGGTGDDDEVLYLGFAGFEDSQPSSGPGEALWQALQAARGDLVIWADPHIVGFEARLFYGLAGPLLTYPEFQLAVGFYSDAQGDDAEHSHPVRSELVELGVRPLLSGLFPPLAGVINPLLLIGAARRDHLEHLSLFTNTAFTPGLLIDTLARAGLMSIAQVDLGLPPLSDSPASPQRLISDVLEILMHRLGERSQTGLMQLYSPGVKYVEKRGGVYSLEIEPPLNLQREIPPLAYTPGYKPRSF